MSGASTPIFWLTPAGSEVLSRTTEVAREVGFDPARAALKLKRLLPHEAPDTLNRALDIVIARAKGRGRLGAWTESGLLTTRSVEQASRPEIARRHAARFGGVSRLLEIGTGSGCDTAFLARSAHAVTSLEPDAELGAMARHNLSLQGIANVEVVSTSAEEFEAAHDLRSFDGLFADPSRRDDEGRRLKSGDAYRPSLDFLLGLQINGIRGIKISPALDVDLPPGWTREFIGFGGECLEQTVWFGADLPDRSVFIADVAAAWSPTGESTEPEYAAIEGPLTGCILDPHPALVRSRSLDGFYAAHHISQLDPSCAYGIAPHAPPSPFYQTFRIIESMPFRMRDLAARLESLGWNSRTEIKKRGVDEDPDDVRKKLKLKRSGGAHEPHGVVLLGRRGGSTVAVLAERITAPLKEMLP